MATLRVEGTWKGALDRGAYERERGKREVNDFSERRTLRIRLI